MKRNQKLLVLVLALVMALGVVGLTSAQDLSGDLEIFTWWTGGGEAAGKDALFAKFAELNPGVNIIDSAIAGGSGVNAKAVLTTRMLGGDPPDTFQVHAGAELNLLWVKAGRVEPLNDMFEANGWMEQYPQGLLDLISDEAGNIYSVPVNIHRSNVLWFVPGKLEEWGVTVPASWDEFVTTTCPALQAKDVTPIAIGENWTQSHLWESVALGALGVDGYNGLWNGQTNWTSPSPGCLGHLWSGSGLRQSRHERYFLAGCVQAGD